MTAMPRPWEETKEGCCGSCKHYQTRWADDGICHLLLVAVGQGWERECFTPRPMVTLYKNEVGN